MLRLTLSNRFEHLLDCLIQRLDQERPGPFEAQQIIIPSLALQRSIEFAVADRLGVCAQMEFAFLGQWLWTQMGRVIPIQESSPFRPAIDLPAAHTIDAGAPANFGATRRRSRACAVASAAPL